MRQRVVISENSVPRLPRHIRLRREDHRDPWVAHPPRRLLVPDELALELVRRCDGRASVATIVNGLSEKFAAPREELAVEVTGLLQDLADQGFLTT